MALLTLVCLRAKGWPWVFRAWPVPYALFILALTPPTASVLRFSLLLGAVWWPIPEWSRRLASPIARAALASTVLLVGIVLQYCWLRSYFVIDLGSRGHP